MNRHIRRMLLYMGYLRECEHCKEEIFYKRGVIGDMLFISIWAFMLYLFLTQEKPYIEMMQNCTAYLYEILGQPYYGGYNTTFNVSKILEKLNATSSPLS